MVKARNTAKKRVITPKRITPNPILLVPNKVNKIRGIINTREKYKMRTRNTHIMTFSINNGNGTSLNKN